MVAKNKQQEVKTEEQEQAKTIATKHVINPDREHYVDVSNLAVGQTHSATMLIAYEELFQKFVMQIRDTQSWYLEKRYNEKFGIDWKKQRGIPKKFEAEFEAIKANDNIADKELFISSFSQALYKVSRGKEGKLLEILEVLADTDMQTRAPEDEAAAFRNPSRGQ